MPAEEIVFSEGSDADVVAQFAQALSEYQGVLFEVKTCNALIRQDKCPSGRADRARSALTHAAESVIDSFATLVRHVEDDEVGEDEDNA